MKNYEECPLSEWNDYVLSQNRVHFLQLSAYAEVRALVGWNVERPILRGENKEILAGFQILTKTASNGRRIGYIAPAGPYCKSFVEWKELWKHYTKAKAGILDLIKFEPGVFSPDSPMPDFGECGFRPTLESIQPASTMVIDVSKNDEELFGNMPRRGKRYIKKALSGGLSFGFGGEVEASKLSDFIHETYSRRNLHPHPKEYYLNFFIEFSRMSIVKLIVAFYDGEMISGRMFFPVGDTVYSVWGASSIKHREQQANFGLEWKSIQWARDNGFRYFDFWGVPNYDRDYLEANFKSHKEGLWGVYEFKRNFGGAVVKSAGALVYEL